MNENTNIELEVLVDILASIYLDPIIREYRERAKELPKNSTVSTEELTNEVFLLAKQCFQLGIMIGMRQHHE